MTPEFAELTNEELFDQTVRACGDLNTVTVRLLRFLVAIEARRMHLEDAFPSMHQYCVARFGWSDGEAWLRVNAATVIRRFPQLAEPLERGDLHMTNLVLLKDHLTPENVDDLVAAVRGMTKNQLIEYLAARNLRRLAPAQPSTIRKLPKAQTANVVEATRERDIEPVEDMQYRVGLTLDRAERDELLYVRDLMLRQNPSGDLKEVVMTAVRAHRVALERKMFGALTEKAKAAPKTSKTSPSEAKPSRKEKNGGTTKQADSSGPLIAKTRGRIPRAVRREVFNRDGHRCTFTNARGERCRATTLLELDHIVSPLHGGADDPANLRVRCAPHNLFHAEKVFGKDYVAAKVRSSQLKPRAGGRARSRASA